MSAPVVGGPLGEVTCVSGESFAVSTSTGDVLPGTDHGFYVRDTRFLCGLELLVDGRSPEPLNGGVTGSGRASFHAFVRSSRSHEIDPSLLVTRRRVVRQGMSEELSFDNSGRGDVTVAVEMVLGCDLATVFDVKRGDARQPIAPTTDGDAVRFAGEVVPGSVESVEIRSDPPAQLDGTRMRWRVTVPAGGTESVTIDVVATDRYGTTEVARQGADDRVGRAPGVPAASSGTAALSIRCSETRLTRLLRRSVDDLDSLTVRDPEAPEDRFCAAGSPWYLTLFGRDALWTAFAAAPSGHEVVGGTLRALARRQGVRHHLETEEEPGKILHEVRRGALTHEGAFPPNYYGSVDATPLFVMVLSEAWRWGMPDDQVRALLPNLEAALGWMRDHGDPDGDGFLEYLRPGERGLVNQGWKDSVDGIQHRDGSLARAPIALVEVQAYAYEAACRGAELLDHFGRDGAADWRAWAERLRARFRDSFWVTDDEGPYLAVALDADKRPVDAVASNMGHVLVTDLLDPGERDLVAARLGDPTMDSGWGLRTMSTASTGYNPLGYHTGSVWPHDTAIAVWGLARGGHHVAASSLLRGLVRASPHVRYRLPELISGLPLTPGGYPVPYPVACRPQAWSAAGSLLLLRACVGAEAHLPEGRMTLRPLWPPPFEHLAIDAYPIAGGELDLRIDARAGVDVVRRGTAPDVTVHRGP